jgi:hypothetical protein
VYSSSAPWSFVDGTKPLVESDTTSTKLRFVDQLADRPTAALTLGTPVPGTVYLRSPTAGIQTRIGGDTSWGYNGTAYRVNANSQHPAQSETVLVPVRTDRAGRLAISVNTLDAKSTDRLELFVNGTRAGGLTPSAAAQPGQPATTTALTVALPAGLSVLRLRAQTGSVWVRDVVISAGR